MKPKNISRRDYFAAMALQGMLSGREHRRLNDPVWVLTADAVICADALIKELEENND